ncbi:MULTISPECIES: hypothetical protein [unclassified Prochlorococcus]|uniref:hypothetical protein n=1 Tax=unclassified Prochlorococcus TaxID=2627481 RepID=UPI0005337AA6|nr:MULTISPECIES: hypothetical protein [unclassified Prochlorococcus]KGG16228.1 Cyanobacteria-specific protein containing UvrC-like endonuclease domain [Prochlorococcus sp. MIT 0603]KGG18038.1 Cyanobacteria-specific protein containing UvrC-like endonuclease domain [Prochlorococcus sp. MIT 0602]
MNLAKGQGELFDQDHYCDDVLSIKERLSFKKELIQTWQKRIYSYQESLLKSNNKKPLQQSIFFVDEANQIANQPQFLKLTPFPLNFWRWPQNPHYGPAIYIVMDRPKGIDSHIVLYIGETVASERRWKGEHDCKKYLQAYSEACQMTGLGIQLSIRFWKDVPKETKPRRKLEQELIREWLPAFNKETRGVWNSPFTNDIN